jgi:DNA-directed RNA polymerase beta' subunit
MFKLHKTVDTNFSARSTGTYDLNQQPGKGGIAGSKGLGMMEVNSLLAHNARNILKEIATVKSQKNDEYWNAVRAGKPLPTPSDNFAFSKFMGMLKGMNVKVDRKGSYLSFAPMTDREVTHLSSGEIQNPKMVKSKDLIPERGGLFDFGKTGGHVGTKWSHISLDEPVVNPLFSDSVKTLLNVDTTRDFEELQLEKDGNWFKKELSKLDLDQLEKDTKKEISAAKGAKLNKLIKKIKYIQSLKENELKPQDAYVISKVPVIPPYMRQIQENRSTGGLMTSGPNYLYRDLMLHNEALREAKKTKLPDKEVKKARQSLITGLSAVQGLTVPNSPQLQNKNIKGFLDVITGGEKQPKEGYLQSVLLSRNADFTGRGTASPDPMLNIDEIGIPDSQAWVMFEPFIMRKLTQMGYSPLDAKDHIERKTELANKLLTDELKQRPVLINRAPTLWKQNIMAAYPKRVPGKVLKVQPLIEEGMNLDYDGDALTLHVPVDPKAVQEAKKMTIRTNFFSDKVKDDLLVKPSQEPVLGIWAATQKPNAKKQRSFKNKSEAFQALMKGDLDINDPVKFINTEGSLQLGNTYV